MKLDTNKVALLLQLAFLTAPARAATRARYEMGTVLEITVEGPRAADAVAAAFAEVERLDRLFSNYRDDSELSALVREGFRRDFRCSEDLFELLTRSAEAWRLSGGAFDMTVRRGAPAPGFGKVRLRPEGRVARLSAPLILDPGGIGKGYALDKAAAVLRAMGVTSALLNFGGQLLAVGSRDVVIDGAALRLRDASASTSSQSEKPGHILDPRTGLPVARRGSVTVVAPDATSADYWSTALFVLGPAGVPSYFHHRAIWRPDSAPHPGPRRDTDDTPHRSISAGASLAVPRYSPEPAR